MTHHPAETQAPFIHDGPPANLIGPELTPDPIRIYVACLAAYNNGHLHGRWIVNGGVKTYQMAV